MPLRYGEDGSETRQLRYFSVLARVAHFGRAADVLHVAQPALSRQVRLLEEELGVLLFERHARGATPTEAALVLQKRAAFILRYLDQTRSDVAATQEGPRGQVGIGMSSGLALTLAAPLFDELSLRYPDVRLQVVEDFTDGLRERLLHGVLDLAILNGTDVEPPNLVTTPLVHQQVCLIGRSDNARVQGDAVGLTDLLDVPLVLTGISRAGVRSVVETAAARAGIPLTRWSRSNRWRWRCGSCRAATCARRISPRRSRPIPTRACSGRCRSPA